MFTLAATPQSVGRVLLTSLQLYKKALFKSMPFSFIYALLIVFPDTVNLLHPAGLLKSWSIFMNVLVNLFGLWILAALFYQIGQIMYAVEVDEHNAYLFALQKYLVYLVTGFVFFVAFGLSACFLIIPGIYVHLLLMFYFPCILFDNDDVFSSLRHSAELVWGNWWRTFFVFIIPVIFMGIIVFLIEVVFDIPLVLLFRFAPTQISISTHVILAIILTVFLPWVIAVIMCQYHDLKLRHWAKSQLVVSN